MVDMHLHGRIRGHHKFTVASMVSRRAGRTFSDLACGTGVPRIHRGTRIRRDTFADAAAAGYVDAGLTPGPIQPGMTRPKRPICVEDRAFVEDRGSPGDCRATLGSGMAHRCHGHGAPCQALRSTRKLLIPGPAAGLERQETPRISKYAAPGQLSARCG